MKISDLEKMLKLAKEMLGDVEIFEWDIINKLCVSTINNKGEIIELSKGA